jgi:hypothetical protein
MHGQNHIKLASWFESWNGGGGITEAHSCFPFLWKAGGMKIRQAVMVYDIVYDSKTINLLLFIVNFLIFFKSMKSLQNSLVTDLFYLLYLLECKMTLIWDDLQNKMSAKTLCFSINCIRLIHKACQILQTVTNQCHCLHLTVNAFIFITFTPNIPILFTATPQHIIINLIYCIVYTALFKTLQSLLKRCTAMSL